MGAAPPSFEPQHRRALRFAIGMTAAFTLTQVVAWPVNFLVVAVAIALLQQPRPMPLGKGFLTILLAVLCIWACFLLSLALLAYPAVLVLGFSLLLGAMYRIILTSNINLVVLVGMLIGTTIVPVLTRLLPELAFVAVLSFTLSLFVGWLVATFAFAAMPPPRRVPRAHGHGDPGDVSATAFNLALVAGTMLAIFLSFGRTDVVMMLYTALFAMSLSTAGARAMGVSYVLATLVYGGVATLLIFEILVMAPFLPLAIALFFFAIYLFGYNTFSHRPDAGEWSSGSFAFVILLSGLLASEKVSATASIADRLVQIATAAVFVAFAFALLEYIQAARRREAPRKLLG